MRTANGTWQRITVKNVNYGITTQEKISIIVMTVEFVELEKVWELIISTAQPVMYVWPLD
jgi:hypothetical protein